MKHLSVLFFLFLKVSLFASNEGTPIVNNFGSKDYQGGSRIYAVACNSNGLLFAGDKTGVLIFDGETWQKIECAFPVTSIAIDASDAVYIAGAMGIGVIEADSTNSWHYTSLNNYVTTESRFKKSRLSKVFSIQDDVVFVLGNELLIDSPERIRIIESPYQFLYFQKLDEVLYLYSSKDGIFRFNNNKLELVSDNESILNLDIKGFLNLNGSLHLIDNKNSIFGFNQVSVLDNESELNTIIRNNNISGIEQIDDSTYTLKTFYNGLYIVNDRGAILKRYSYSNGLINNTVFSTYKDEWNNLWVGTAAGISSIRIDFPYTIYNNWEGIGTGYSAITYKNQIYLATSQGLYRRDVDNDGNTHYVKLFDNPVWNLHIIEDQLYFGHVTGIFHLNKEKIQRVSYYPGGWNIKKIPASEDLFITNSPLGLVLMKLSESNVLKTIGLIEGINKSIHNFEFDSLNNVWAEFDNGVCSFILSDDNTKAVQLTNFDRIESGNQLKKVRKILDKVYFIADSGVYLFDHKQALFNKSKLFNDFYQKGSYPTNFILDKYNKLWVFAQEELTRYEIIEGKLKKTSPTGFEYSNKSYPLDYENIFNLDQNLVLIGQEQGFVCFNLSNSKRGAYSAVSIRKVEVKTKSGKVHGVWGKEQIIENTLTIQLDKEMEFASNSIKFYFSAGCSNFDHIQYQTYLYGFDEKWTAWSLENVKEYTNLPSGDYQFVVRSINKSNEFSHVTTFKFSISPPWYFTLWAKIAYVLLFLILLWGTERLIKLRAKGIRLKLELKEKELTYRKEQLRIQENLQNEKEIIKLRNEKLRIDNLNKSKELANSAMNIINKNQFLSDLKSELGKIQDYSEQNKIVTDDVKKLMRKVNRDLENEENWKVFEDYFDSVHENFFKKMKQKHPILTTKDLRLCAYLRMNLSTKEIAPLMNISVRGVEIGRYRLRKKLGLDHTASLNDFLFKI